MKVVPYNPKYKNDFIEMNRKWIEEMFVMEAEDIATLEGVDKLIAQGAEIYFTLDDDDNVLACCMLEPHEGGDWEIAKFASKGKVKGAGTLCLQACIDAAKRKGLDKILIVSNLKCEAGIHLYRKFGFKEIPVDKKIFPYERANIAFEMYLREQKFTTPPNHEKFLAKKLFDGAGKIQWGAVAYIEVGGGGPVNNHAHEDDHIFIVVDGTVKIIINGVENIVSADNSFYVKGSIPHSIWNAGDKTAKVIKISIKNNSNEQN